MSTVPGLDVAFSSYSKADADALFAAGYRVVGVCLQTGGLANNDTLLRISPANLLAFRQAGFYCFGYLNANPGTPGWITTEQCLEYAKRNAGSEWNYVQELVIDFEIAGTPWNRVFELASVVRAEKTCRIVYTSKSVIDALSIPPDAATALDLKLWLAHYDNIPDLGVVPVPEPWASAV